jgi:hypothetical protein
MKTISFVFFIICCLFVIKNSYSQVEMTPASDAVYDYLDRMLTMKIIDDYSSSMKPISRGEIGKYLNEINNKRKKISTSDKKILDWYLIEYEYDINKTLKNTSSFLSGFKFSEIFSSKKQKYLYATSDSSSSFFFDGILGFRYNAANGDSAGKPSLLLGQLGGRFRGTLFNSVGYYLRLSNGVRLSGEIEDALFAAQFDPVLASTRKFVSEGSKTFDSFEGYIKYATKENWLGLTIGREAINMGTGFIDKMYISSNIAPMDFIKLDLRYKKINYSFLTSSIVGNDTSGNQLSSKYLVYHRLELGPFINNTFKIGFNEMLVYSNVPLNLAFLNPLSFLTSADLNTEIPGKNSNNTLIGVDVMVYPVKGLAVQGSLLIDDLNFSTMGSDSTSGNDNKFGFQAGLNWQNAFLLKNLSLSYEFIHLDPFVYSHRDFNNSYANWNLPIGLALNPNSDEHAIKLAYNFGNTLTINLTYKHQRSGMNITDSTGKIITNVGSDINDGRNDFAKKNEFLNGLRVNRDIIIGEIIWQPIKQYYLSIKYQQRKFNYIDQNRTLTDNIFWGGLKIDY